MTNIYLITVYHLLYTIIFNINRYMHLNKPINQLSTIKNLDALTKLQSLLKDYDWDHDAAVKSNNNRSDPAFNDSYCIQFTSSDLICHISSNYKRNYSQSTLEIVNLGEILTNEVLQLFPNHYHLKSHFVSIKPKGKQICHVDNAFYHKYSNRLVIPITTKLSKTMIDDKEYHLDIGSIYEMNNRLPHWSENYDDDFRVFLFLDVISSVNLGIIKIYYHY